MARKVREEDYTGKRNEILDAAQKLIYTRGYEQMTIQGILDEVRISKGAFYHYFDSKQALLQEMIDRMFDDGEALLRPIVENPDMNALEKLQCYFAEAGRWKTAQMDLLMELLRVWYMDENAIVRGKIFLQGLKRVAPVLSQIFLQGLQEGSMSTGYPEEVGEGVMGLVEGLGETYARRLLSTDPGDNDLGQIRRITNAYQEAIERTLGTPKGCLSLVDDEMMAAWFGSAKKTV